MKNVLLLSALLVAGTLCAADSELGIKTKMGRFTDEAGNRRSLRLEAKKENGVHVNRSTRIEEKNVKSGDHNKNSVNLSHYNKQ